MHWLPDRIVYHLARRISVHSGIEDTSSDQTKWGRLVVATMIGTGIDEAAPPSIRAVARRVHVPASRPQSARLDVEAEDRVRVEPVGPHAFWVTGTFASEESWIEVTARGLASRRVPVMELREGSPELPLRIDLRPGLALAGTVTSAGGEPAAGAVVALYRLDRPTENDPTRIEKRIAVGEQVADVDGVFRFSDLTAEPYEIVASHATLGRAQVRAEPDGRSIDVRLRPFSRAVGRVVSDGIGIGGVNVTFVPNLAEYQASRDVTTLRGGESLTDANGRFSVPLPVRGNGEIRIAAAARAVRRIPIAAAETLGPTVDLGTIALAPSPTMTIVFEGSDRCELLLTGPAGRTGLSMVKPVRIGPALFQAVVPEAGSWLVVAICGREERAVTPPTILIQPGRIEQSVRIGWP